MKKNTAFTTTHATRRSLLATAFVTTFAAADAAAPAPRPNILIILADDLGARDLACYNPDTFYETPNLDRLARQGVRFTAGYAANPVSSPTRVSLQTGRYPTRTNNTYYFDAGPIAGKSFDYAPPKITDHLPLDEETLAEGLKKAGYQTAFLGKWHLGTAEKYWPENHGYDTNIAGWRMGSPNTQKLPGKKKGSAAAPGAPNGYFSPYGNPRLKDGPKGEYLPERLAAEAITQLRKMAADKTRPFYLCHCFYLVHTPLQAREQLIAKYKTKAQKQGITDATAFGNEEQNWPETGPRRIRTRQGNPTYAAMVEALDTAAGQILDELDHLGLADNTIVIFTSDNGGLATTGNASTSNLPLRAGKGWLYEGGIREPFLIRWPAVVKPNTTNDTPIMTIDILPTLYAAAGAPLPAKKIDGQNLLPLLQNNTPLPRDALYWDFPHYGNQGGFPGGAIRMGDWKLIERYVDGRVQLYNLATDPGEHHDLAATDPQRAATLRARLHAWYRETGARFLQQKPNGPAPWRPTPPAD